jgi:hypothetical protein
MSVTAREFSDELKVALEEEQFLLLTLVNGRQHRVLSPVLITDSAVEFTGYNLGHRNVVAWKEISFVQRERQQVTLVHQMPTIQVRSVSPAANADGGSPRYCWGP